MHGVEQKANEAAANVCRYMLCRFALDYLHLTCLLRSFQVPGSGVNPRQVGHAGGCWLHLARSLQQIWRSVRS